MNQTLLPTILLAIWLLAAHPTPASASDHGLTLVAASPTALAELSTQLPPIVQSSAAQMLVGLAGPLAVAATPDEPLGVFLDWHGPLPSPVMFLHAPQMDRLRSHLEANQLTPEDLGSGIFRIPLDTPIFYRESMGWLFVGPSKEHLHQMQNAPTELDATPQHALQISVKLNHVPLPARTEIAKTLAIRLLPEHISAGTDVTPETLMQLYVTRLLSNIATQGDSIQLTLDSTDQGLQLAADVDGSHFQANRNIAEKFSQTRSLKTPALVQLSTSFSDEEVAMLSWWAQSLPDQVSTAFSDAAITKRTGEAAVRGGASLIGQLIGDIALQGNAQGFACFVGEESDTPLVGLRIPSGEKFEQRLREFLSRTDTNAIGIAGAEFNIKQIDGVNLHRLTFSEQGQAAMTMVLGVGADRLFITADQTGLHALTDFLNTPATAIPAEPLRIRIPNVPIGSVLGWKSAKSSTTGTVSITSQTTQTGVHYDIAFDK